MRELQNACNCIANNVSSSYKVMYYNTVEYIETNEASILLYFHF